MEDNGDLLCLPCGKYFIVNPLGGGKVTRNSGVGRNTTAQWLFACPRFQSYSKKKNQNHKCKDDKVQNVLIQRRGTGVFLPL